MITGFYDNALYIRRFTYVTYLLTYFTLAHLDWSNMDSGDRWEGSRETRAMGGSGAAL